MGFDWYVENATANKRPLSRNRGKMHITLWAQLIENLLLLYLPRRFNLQCSHLQANFATRLPGLHTTRLAY